MYRYHSLIVFFVLIVPYQKNGTKAAQRTLNEIDKMAMKYMNEMNRFIDREK